jgi:hypothetical protein
LFLQNGGTRKACSPNRNVRHDFFSKERPRDSASPRTATNSHGREPIPAHSSGSRSKKCARGRSCTRTIPLLKRTSLLLDYTGNYSRPDLHRHCTGFKPAASPVGLREQGKWSPRQELHLHSFRSERSASALGYAGKNWHSRQEFRLQPPRSKRGALIVELQERLKLAVKVGGSWRSCSPSHEVERSVFKTVPARLSGSASKMIEPPRCRPVLCGLRIRRIAAMLATQGSINEREMPLDQARGHSPRLVAQWHDILKVLPKAMSERSASNGRPTARGLYLARHENGETNGIRTRTAAFTKPNAELLQHGLHQSWILRSAPPRHNLLYKRSAFLSLPRRN